MNSIQELLKKHDLKATPQRIAILTEIVKAGHISVDDIYSKTKDYFPSMSLATIYKNINSLKECDILYEIKTQNSKAKYEIQKSSHAHFICQLCNAVEDLNIIKDDFKNYGKYNQIDLYLYGVCKNCSS
jgi:Fe2+ or Zn2+ uptake regulation protein